jgi:hypothetical protein
MPKPIYEPVFEAILFYHKTGTAFALRIPYFT